MASNPIDAARAKLASMTTIFDRTRAAAGIAPTATKFADHARDLAVLLDQIGAPCASRAIEAREGSALTSIRDDASDVVALATRLGLAGFSGRADKNDTPSGKVKPEDDASDLVALATKCGLPGFRARRD